MNMRALTPLIVAGVAIAIGSSGCSSKRRSNPTASTSAAVTADIASALPTPNPAGQGYSVFFEPPGVAGARISALGVGPGVVVAGEAPVGKVYGLTASVASATLALEADLYFDVTSLVPSDNATFFASTGNADAPGAGDVWKRDGGTWAVALDTTDDVAQLAAIGSDVYAVTGAMGAGSTVYRLDAGAFSTVASIESVVPTSVTPFKGELWVGTTSSSALGGPARLFRVQGAAVEEVSVPVALIGAGVYQRVTATASFTTGGVELLVLAIGEFDEAGNPLSGALLLTTGDAFEVIHSYKDDAPLALAWLDDTIYAGSATGALEYREDDGSFSADSNFPANTGIHSLLVEGSDLYAGVGLSTGATVFLRDGGSGGPSTTAPPPNFKDDIFPQIRAACSVLACHGGNIGASTYVINADMAQVYDDTVLLVNSQNPELSDLLTKPAEDGVTHPGGPVPGWEKGSGTVRALTIRWIATGMEKGFSGGTQAKDKTFHDYVYPVLRNTCGMAACHGSAVGGFEMSADEDASFASTVQRSDANNVAQSLVLTKAAQDGVTHGGGIIPLHEKGPPAGYNYQLVVDWINDGMKR
jgi:hypothetical protein